MRTEDDGRPASGVLVRPVWRKPPGSFEMAMAFALAMVPLAGLLGFTVKVGDRAWRDGSLAAGTDRPGKAGAKGSGGGLASTGALALAAVTARRPGTPERTSPPGDAPGGAGEAPTAAPARRAPSLAERFLLGRKVLASGLAFGARRLRFDIERSTVGTWIGCVLLVLLGPVFCFLGWPLRRASTAMLGALVFGWAAYETAAHFGMQWSGALVVSLAPAFLGALLGWHLVVAYTTLLSGSVLGITALMLTVMKFGPPGWLPLPVTVMLFWSTATIVVYLLGRAALISGWAALGAFLITAWVVLGVGGSVGGLPLWDLFLATFTLLVVAGTTTQYRLATRREDLAAEAAATPEGRRMLRRLQREAAGGD
jgi:hypothetical protein